MKKLIRVLLLLFAVIALAYANGGMRATFANTTQTIGNLIFDFHVRSGDPIFVIEDVKPGDEVKRSVTVRNKGTSPKLVKVKGIRTGGIESDPKIETVLEITIKDGSNILYGPKKLLEFFTDSQIPGGVTLSTINPSTQKAYKFIVRFPILSGNEFQNKSVIFDLIFSST